MSASVQNAVATAFELAGVAVATVAFAVWLALAAPLMVLALVAYWLGLWR